MHDEPPGPKHDRRKTDRCIAKRLWEAGTPYLQGGGFFTILGGLCTVAVTTFSFIQKTEAYGPLIAANTESIAELHRQVSDQHDSILVMQQELHWMYRRAGGKD